ncbi:unnamed protein product [Cuscuta campestris]|uniref:F-box domain-containing protein n=1 Tax=Cuscuta campestris TaxID=132261 RepID=A0A484MT67_9ASTE|nr:unnamed protein product [Cuscuta campestris]
MTTAGNWFAADEGNGRSSRHSLERLPDSIICEFLQKLDLESLCAAACVSRTLRSAVYQVLASLSSLDLTAFPLDPKTLQLIVGRFEGVKSVAVDCLRVVHFDFINILGAQIRELNLLKCSSPFHNTLSTIGARFPNLRVLSIELAGQGLPEVITKHLATMLKDVSYLESLSLKVHVTEDNACIFQSVHLFLPKTLKSLKLQPVDQQHFIHSLVPTVTIFTKHLCSYSSFFNLKILSLVLDIISDELVLSIVNFLPFLVELGLEDRPHLEPPMHLDLTNAGLQSLGALEQLTVLSIIRSRINLPVYFKRVNDMGMLILFENCRGLESLKLGGFSKVTDAGFSAILHSCQKLKKLDLRYALLLSDLAFHNVKEVASSLVKLRLLSCNLLTSEALEELSSFGKLEVLDLSGCRSIANPCLSYVSSLRTLTSLSLAGSDITDEGLAILGRGSSLLTHLCVKGCKRISEKGIHKLFHGEGKIGNELLCLDISYMAGISDAAVETITSSAKALTDLCMRYCFFVTNAAVEMLASKGKLNDESTPLRKLDLCNCTGLSDDLVESFDEAFFPGLHWLGVGFTVLKSRKDHFDAIWASRPWLTVCFDGCELGCHDGWQFHV